VIILLLAIGLGLTGCAAHAPYFRLDSSLQRDIRTFNSSQYVPLIRLCDVYGIDYKWDGLVKTVTLQRKAHSVVLRAASDRMLVDGDEERLDRPAVIREGVFFVPVSFARNTLGPMLAEAPVVRKLPPAEEAKR